MAIDVNITNSNFNKWLDDQNADRDALQAQTLLWTLLFAAQLLIYYNLWKDAVDKRDAVIDDMERILSYLHETDLAVDYPMMLKQQEVLNVPLPKKEMCTDAVRFDDETRKDGDAVDDLSFHFTKMDCCSPIETTEGQLYSARASNYTGGVLANSSKRRQESFRKNKTALVLRAQATSRMAIAPILAALGQAMSIYEGLASTFLQGFNSAGAGLGVNLQRLASGRST